ncbi:hypothetical protein M513_07118 [Trichuris suis]|uniref:CCHC-type domain-containing protein n=1 Tax=Trichuris suis TaxID=68888 RepID=A0A085M440_9BILA|nr:hypothetical protein M513_07118 [Trichuris suis]
MSDSDCAAGSSRSSEPPLFVIDRNPFTNAVAPLLPPPRFTSPLPGDKCVETASPSTKEAEKGDSFQSSSKYACFNCGKPDHKVGDCPERYSPETVRRNRIKHRANQRKNYGRAHQFINHGFEPGKISDELREAIGLGRRQLPPWIYQMRRCGYPPGYKRVALARIPKLSFHDDASSSSGVEYEKFDESCIVEYPGFNVPPPHDVIDEYRRHRAPPFSLHHHGKSRLIREIKRKLEEDDRAVRTKKRRLDEKTDSKVFRDQPQPSAGPPIDEQPSDENEPSETSLTNSSIEVGDEMPSTSSGEILAQRTGTPAPFVVHKYGFEKPSLEKFSAGMQKLEYQNRSQPNGVSLFKRLSLLRKQSKETVKQFLFQKGQKHGDGNRKM